MPPAADSRRPLAGATIAFDLDGTLVDTAPDLVRVTNAILAEDGLAPVPADTLRGMVGHGARALIVSALAWHGRDAEAGALDGKVGRFIALYAAGLTELSRPYPGVAAALERLAGLGATLSVCTNKPPQLARPVLEAFGLDRFFAAMVAAGEAPANKPDPAHLALALARAGGGPQRALMVGDSETDLEAGRRLGVPVALASFGYATQTASALGADAVFDHYDRLPDLALALIAPGTDRR